jgi:hypothetical protein
MIVRFLVHYSSGIFLLYSFDKQEGNNEAALQFRFYSKRLAFVLYLFSLIYCLIVSPLVAPTVHCTAIMRIFMCVVQYERIFLFFWHVIIPFVCMC